MRKGAKAAFGAPTLISTKDPGYLVSEKGVDCTLLGSTLVRYNAKGALIPGAYQVSSITVLWDDGTVDIYGDAVHGQDAKRIRDGKAANIDVTF